MLAGSSFAGLYDANRITLKRDEPIPYANRLRAISKIVDPRGEFKDLCATHVDERLKGEREYVVPRVMIPIAHRSPRETRGLGVVRMIYFDRRTLSG